MSTSFVVLGNGAIGTLSAIQLKKQFPDYNIYLIGNPTRLNSASTAAGAMCNVFAEIEAPFSAIHQKQVDLSLWYGISGRNGWLKFIESDPNFQKLRTAKDTLVFLKKDASDFETLNYKAAKDAAFNYGVAREVESKLLKQIFESARNIPAEAFQIEGEFAIDTKELFSVLSKICVDLGILILNEEVVKIDLLGSEVLMKNQKIHFDKIVIALGSNSSIYLPPGSIQTLVQGVGTAMEIREKGIAGILSDKSRVIRTVNRGGAQCGFHFVPRNDGFYLGAGNYIMAPGNSYHRLETLRYLFSTFEREVCGSKASYLLEGELVKGHRPRAIDGFPLIGQLLDFPRVFVATGTNRAGLTWAPKISSQVVTWARGDREDSPNAEFVAPGRAELNFGTEEDAIRYYVESRLSAALEHKQIESSNSALDFERNRLRKFAQSLLFEVRKSKNKDLIVPHPDHWAVILDQASKCID